MDDGTQEENGEEQEAPTWPSVDDAAPLEEGGSVARKGFMQKTMEIEGPFREVMQFYDDVAMAWLGTWDWIIAIQQYDRPFYLSHHTFWL